MPLLMCSSYPCDICLKSIWHLYSLFSLCCDLVLISEYAADSFFGAGHACWHTLISKVVYPIFSILVVYLTMLVCHQCNACWNIASVQLCTHLNEGSTWYLQWRNCDPFLPFQVAVPISGPFIIWSSSMVLASTSSFHPLLSVIRESLTAIWIWCRYLGMAIAHIPCFFLYWFIVKAKHTYFPRMFPHAYIRTI